MAVVRELVTKLGFKVDKTGIDKFEKSIIGFKTKFVLASAAVTGFVSKTLSYFSGISDAALATEELARNARIATSEFVALRRAAEDFRVEPQVFESSISTLTDLLREAQTGFGELFNIMTRARGKLNLTDFIASGDVKGALVEILQYVGSLEKVGDQLAALGDIFGSNNANSLLRLVNAGSEAFLKGAEANKIYGDSFVANIPKTKEYAANLNAFYKQLEQITQSFVEYILPVVTGTLKYVSQAINGIGSFAHQFSEKGFLGGLGSIGDFFKDLFTSIPEQQQIRKLENSSSMNNNNNINNNVNINVDPKTTEEQAKTIGSEVKVALESFWNEKTREVISNNPQVE